MNVRLALPALAAMFWPLTGCGTNPVESGSGPAKLPVAATPVAPPARSPLPSNPPTGPAGPAMKALQKAAAASRHALVFLQAGDDEPTRVARAKFEAAAAKLGDRADRVVLDRSAGTDAELVARYKLTAAPAPLVLVVAPNGAVTGGMKADEVSSDKLANLLASPAKQTCLKALQDRKLVLLCVQNSSTPAGDAALAGVNAFKTDARFAASTEQVTVDPANASERDFLAELQVPPAPPEAVTVFLAPPGVMLGVFTGATTSSTFEVALAKAMSGGCGSGSGCGPGSKGCAPGSAGCR